MAEKILEECLKTLAILTGSFPPTNIVGALRPFRLAKHIGRRGWRVVVLTHQPKPGEGLDTSLLGELSESHEINYLKCSAHRKDGKSKFRTRLAGATRDILKNWIRPDLDVVHVPAYCRLFKKVHERHAVDVVLTTSPAHSIHLAGLLIKRRFDLPWIVDFRDPWDDFVNTGESKIHNPIERYLENKVINKSSAIISTTNMYTEILFKRHCDVDKNKFVTVTNSYDALKTEIVQNKSKYKFIICNTGIFYPSKDPYCFFRALRKWFDCMTPEEVNRYKNRVEIHLIGSGDQKTRQVINALGLNENVIFFERMPHEKAIEMTLQSDLALISTGLGEKTRPGWLPSKLFEYLGCGIPILAIIREGEMSKIIKETKSGYVVTSEDHHQIANTIKTCIDQKFNHDIYLNKCLKSRIDRYEERNVMKQFISIIEGI